MGGKKLGNKKKVAEAEKMVQNNLDAMRFNVKWLMKEEMENNDVFPTLKGKKAKNLKEIVKKVEAKGKEHSEEEIKTSKEYSSFKDIFNTIEHKDLVNYRHYSLNWVRHLADLLLLRTSCFYLLDRANWIHYSKRIC